MTEQRDPRSPPSSAPLLASPRPSQSISRVRFVARRLPAHVQTLLLVVVTLPALLLADHWCLLATRLPVRVEVTPTYVAVFADGSSLAIAVKTPPDAVRFVSASATSREYQIDGTDNTNNFTEDAADLTALLPTPAYKFEAWMRDNAAYGTWVDVMIRPNDSTAPGRQIAVLEPGAPMALPQGRQVVIEANLERPEAPAVIELMSGDHPSATVTFDRNDRNLELMGANAQTKNAYFPTQPLPFAAEILDSLLRVAIWAWVVLAIVLALTVGLEVARKFVFPAGVSSRLTLDGLTQDEAHSERISHNGSAVLPRILRRVQGRRWVRWIRYTTWADRAGAVVMAAAFGFMLFVALVQYHGQPHILDASAYYFQAKIFASGRISAPMPADLAAFQGPFMVAWQGRWFAQYPPATSALLALGILVGVPWLVEPLLGMAALVGIYLLGRRLFGGPTALLAVLLGALSPFFIYLAASYLSHTVALCFEVYFLLFVMRFQDTYHKRDIVLAGACLGMMFCARELSAVVCGVGVSAWLLAWHGRRLWRDRVVVVPAVMAGVAALAAGFALYVGYNFAQTGDPFLLPRNLFSPADRFGFGIGVGFYGQHTLAAGLVILDQLLTSLLIDLFGWPFYLTLAFIPLALLRRDGARRWDWFNLTLAGLLFVAQAGYFYHGIYLGPRYLYDTIPFLLLLTARGITALPFLADRIVAHARLVVQYVRTSATNNRSVNTPATSMHGVAKTVSGLVVLVLVSFNLTFYLPRQIAQHRNFSGLPAFNGVDVAAIYDNHLHNALVVSDNWMVYNYVLWPLNDPLLTGDTLYAYAPEPTDVNRLAHEFPHRRVYSLSIGSGGAVSFVPLAP